MGRIRLALLIVVAIAAVAFAAYFIDGARTDQYEATAVFGIVDGLPDTDRVRLAGELAPEINSALFLNALNEQIGNGDVRELRASPSENGEIRVKIRSGSTEGIEAGIAGAFAQLEQDQRENRQRQVSNDLGDIERRLIVIDQSLSAGRGDTDLLTAERESLVDEQALLAATIDVSPVELIEPAEVPDSPVSPRPTRTALWAAFGASILGAMALLRFGRERPSATESTRQIEISDLVTPPATAPAARPGLLSSRLAGDTAMAAETESDSGADRRFGRAAPLVAVGSAVAAPATRDEVKQTQAADESTSTALPLLAVAPLLARDPELVAPNQLTVEDDRAEGAGDDAEDDAGHADDSQPDDGQPDETPERTGDDAEDPEEDDAALLAIAAPEDAPDVDDTEADLASDDAGALPGTGATVSPLVGGIDNVARRLDDAEVQASLVVAADGGEAHGTGERLAASLADQGQTAAHLRVTTTATQAERLVFQRWSNNEANVSDRSVTDDKRRPYTQLTIENPEAHDLEAAVAKLRLTNDQVLITADDLDVDGLQSIVSIADALVVEAEANKSPANMANRFAGLSHVATVQSGKHSGGVPWWLIAAGAAVLLAGGIGATIALSGGDDDPAEQVSATIDPDTAAADTDTDIEPGTTAVDADAADNTTADTDTDTDTDTTAAATDTDTDTDPDTTAAATDTDTDAGPDTTAAATDEPVFILVLPDDLPGVEEPSRQGVYRDGQLFLEGEVESQDVADQIIERAAAVIGEENVVNNYVINPDAPRSSAGTVLVDEAILFSPGSAFLDPTDNELLGLGEAVMRLYPKVTMRIIGHTDNIGSAQSNRLLSESRAQAMADYYIAKGIPADRFEVEGRGESQPVGPNLTEEGRAQNRRIVVELIDLLS